MKIVDNFENAVANHEMKGAMHPENHDLIELQYKTAKKELIDYIKKLQTERQIAIDNESRLRFPDRTGQ